MVLRIVPFVGAGGDEELRHLVVVEVALDRGVRRRAEGIECRQHLILLDQLAHQFDGLRRAIAVVAGDEVDLAAVDAALLVDHVEVAGLRLADRAVARSRAAVRHGVAELDLGVAGAGSVLARRQSQSAGDDEGGSRQTSEDGAFHCHDFLLVVFVTFRSTPANVPGFAASTARAEVRGYRRRRGAWRT